MIGMVACFILGLFSEAFGQGFENSHHPVYSMLCDTAFVVFMVSGVISFVGGWIEDEI